MLKVLFFLSFLSLVINTQANTDIERTIDLLERDYVSLYDCDIYRTVQAYDDCRTLKRSLSRATSWDQQGYALSCSLFSGSDYYLCKDLARHLLRGDHPIKCNSDFISSELQKERCTIVKEAYEAGQFQRTSDDCHSCSLKGEVHFSSQQTHSSDFNRCYQGAYQAWEETRASRQQEGKNKVIEGGAIFSLGRIIDIASNNTNFEMIGDIAGDVISGIGATVAAYGLYEWSSATYRPPFEDPYCRQFYTASAPRQVIIHQQQCTTTRYESHSWNHHYFYHQTVCSNQTFYSFDPNPPQTIWY